MTTAIEEQPIETAEEAIARVLRTGRVIHSLEDVYGPGPSEDDPEDLEAFLRFLEDKRRFSHSADEDR